MINHNDDVFVKVSFGMLLFFTLFFVGILFITQVNADYILTVYDRSEVLTEQEEVIPLATKRYISFGDCRRDRAWLLELSRKLTHKGVYILCEPEEQ